MYYILYIYIYIYKDTYKETGVLIKISRPLVSCSFYTHICTHMCIFAYIRCVCTHIRTQIRTQIMTQIRTHISKPGFWLRYRGPWYHALSGRPPPSWSRSRHAPGPICYICVINNCIIKLWWKQYICVYCTIKFLYTLITFAPCARYI